MSTAVYRARSMRNIPYLHQGRDENGVDCIGLLAYAIEYDFSKIPNYPADPYNNELSKALTEAFGPPTLVKPADRYIDKTDLQEGDIVVIQYKGPLRHVGLVANHPTAQGELSLIHTDRSVGHVVEHIIDMRWFRRIEKVWRL